jgi:hypothetical protein
MARPILDDYQNKDGRTDKTPVNHVARGIGCFVLMAFIMSVLLILTCYFIRKF